MLILNYKKRLQGDIGLTLVELLLAVLITSLISIAIIKTTSSASSALNRTAGEVNTNIQVMNFSQKLRFDIAGASDVFVFGQTAPNDYTQLCSSWNRVSNLTWDLSATNSNYATRTLIVIKVNELIDASYVPGSEAPPNFISTPTPKWYGYEVRRGPVKSSDTPTNFELWRVVCEDVNGVPAGSLSPSTPSQKLLDLGALDPVSTNGLQLMTCVPAETTGSSCPEAGRGGTASTTTKTSYSFALPYFVATNVFGQSYNSSTKHLAAKLYSTDSINNSLLKTLKRRIDM